MPTGPPYIADSSEGQTLHINQPGNGCGDVQQLQADPKAIGFWTEEQADEMGFTGRCNTCFGQQP